MARFIKRTGMPVSADELFRWHERTGAFQRLVPPWDHVELVSKNGGIQDGSTAEIELNVAGMPLRWLARHEGFQPGRQFRDVQERGPFAKFAHTHRMIPINENSSILEDEIEYRLPGGWLGQLLLGASVHRKFNRAFTYRHEITHQDLLNRRQETKPMNIIVTGATGLVGKELCALLTTSGHRVQRLVRGEPKTPDDIRWDPDQGKIDAARLEGADAVVHLAGENIAGGRWTTAFKEKIRSSRVDGTTLLATTLAGLKKRPSVFLCASAIGFYGQRGNEDLTETSPPGKGFLPDVCQAWENACEPARIAGIRVINARIGVVLTPKGAALAKMLTPFKMGLGGIVGSGEQFWSWIGIDDVISAIQFCLTNSEIEGPVNVTAPQPVTNAVFTKTLGTVLGRPTLFPMPAFLARIALGEMADDLLLGSSKVSPSKLLAAGYHFRFPQLEGALRHLLGLQKS